MAAVSSYKNPKGSRYLTEEVNFMGGMMHTDNTIDPTYLKTIINFDYDDMRGSLVSRKGLTPKLLQDLPEEGTRLSFITTIGEDPETGECTDVTVNGWLKGTRLLYASTNMVHQFDASLVNEYGVARDISPEAEFNVSCIITGQECQYRGEVLGYEKHAINVMCQAPGSDTFIAARPIEGARNWKGLWTIQGLDQEPIPIDDRVSDYGYFIAPMSDGVGAMPMATLNNQIFCLGAEYSYDWDAAKYLAIPCMYTIDLLYIGDIFYYAMNEVRITAISAREAINSGYNMRNGSETYNFDNNTGAVFTVDGILPYDTDTGALQLTTRLGKQTEFRMLYTYDSTTTVKAVWDWTPMNTTSDVTTWNSIGTVTDIVPPGVVKIVHTPAVEQFIIRVTVYRGTSGTPTATAMFPVTNLVNTGSRAELKTYDIHKATGVLSWRNRIVLYGVPGAESVIFISDINNPGYFPYPNNVHIVDGTVLRIVPYLDGMLVFTRDRIYLVEQGMDGLSFTSKVVQNRLNIVEEDAKFIQIIKNMVFFKANNYFYMVVPKATSLTGELTIAPISKVVQALLNDHANTLPALVRSVYEPWFIHEESRTSPGLVSGSIHDGTAVFETMHYRTSITSEGLLFNYVDGNVIRNVYAFNIRSIAPDTGETVGPADNLIVYMFINYDTVTRAWNLYTAQGNGRGMLPYQQLSTGTARLLNIVGVQYDFNNNAVDGDIPKLQVLAFDTAAGADTHKMTTRSNDKVEFGNIQFIDTGYRKQSESLKKRYREIQFKVYSTNEQPLSFGTAFLLDGHVRRSYSKYVPVLEDGVFTIEQDITADYVVEAGGDYVLNQTDLPDGSYPGTVGATILGDTAGELLNAFTLDSSALPQHSAVKVRFPVSGKGYAPRMQLRSFTEAPFELTNINWVFRIMNGR